MEIIFFGNGYGESILIKLSNDDLVLIDSCYDYEKMQSAALTYLQNEGIDFTKAIKSIIITHWHDDHVKGLADVIEKCKGANVFIPNGYTGKEFIDLLLLRAKRDYMPGNEFSKILTNKSLRESNRLRKAGAQTFILHLDQNRYLEALSPSGEESQLLFDSLAASFVTGKLPDKKNGLSIAIRAIDDDSIVLLGADVEYYQGSVTKGWGAILNEHSSRTIATQHKADLFKIPHHGSITGHCDEVYSSMLVPDPLLIICSFSPSKLPRDSDINRLKSYSGKIIVLKALARKVKRNRRVSKGIKEQNCKVTPEPNCSKVIVKKHESTWNYEISGNVQIYT